MRCEEIQERFIDFIYDEGGISPESTEIKEHLRACSACREELEELKQTRKYLQFWKDESPLRSVTMAERNAVLPWRFRWKYVRYAAIAAMLVACFLALTNAQITWNKDGFSFSTRLLPGRQSGQNYYTKAEVVDLMKQVLDDSEVRMNETSRLMMQEVLNTIDQDRYMDARLVRGHAAQYQNRN
jgi:hypothetical protein